MAVRPVGAGFGFLFGVIDGGAPFVDVGGAALVLGWPADEPDDPPAAELPPVAPATPPAADAPVVVVLVVVLVVDVVDLPEA